MRPTLTLLAALAALVSGCAEELVDTGSEPLVEESADTALAYGDPLADGNTEEFDSIVHPVRGRIDLTISATGPLKPNAGVALSIHGVAREPIDSGEVVLALPTRALMDHAGGKGLPELPVKARWDLPAMAEGDTWSGSYTVPGEAEGYYRVMANAYTHGPDGGAYLSDDALVEAWMYVSETDGQLTRFFEDSLFPDSVHPMAGPAAGWPTGAGVARNPDYPFLHPDSVYLHMVYTVSVLDGFEPAVGTEIWGSLKKRGWYEPLGVVTVPEDGVGGLQVREGLR